ncbi:MAG: hypothetical protein P1U54_14120 [Immundisolibacteraceae bacterium]|nr:hypothetical protein [Immundisolibacteraceae bacterium]
MNKLVVLVVCVFLSGCNNSGPSPQLVYRFPLIAKCEEKANQILDRIPKSVGFYHSINIFDKTVPSSPSVIGYVEVSTDEGDVIHLKGISNAIMGDCYPMAKESISKTGLKWGEKLQNSIDSFNKLGIGETYVVIGDKEIEVYFSQMELNKINGVRRD